MLGHVCAVRVLCELRAVKSGNGPHTAEKNIYYAQYPVNYFNGRWICGFYLYRNKNKYKAFESWMNDIRPCKTQLLMEWWKEKNINSEHGKYLDTYILFQVHPILLHAQTEVGRSHSESMKNIWAPLLTLTQWQILTADFIEEKIARNGNLSFLSLLSS